jgi:hypothetical protein
MAYALLILIMALAIPHIPAQGAEPLPSVAKEYLQLHNQARAEVGVGPLKWSEELAHTALRLARYQQINLACSFATLKNHKYDGNQAMGLHNKTFTPGVVFNAWVKNKPYYDYDRNLCQLSRNRCRAYTRVVWRKALELGCAQATCETAGTSIYICLYNPPGNIKGERPY